MRWACVTAGLAWAACVPHLSGAPCHDDDNCPVNQYCDGANCQTGAPPATRVLSVLVTTPAGILPLGASVQATATAVLQSGDHQDVTATATWSSTNALVAEVSNDAGSVGVVSALSTGEVDVQAVVGTTGGTAHLVVTDAELVTLVVTVDRPVVAARSDVNCTLTGFFTDGTHADLTSLAMWTSSQPAVVSVSNAPGSVGALTALSTGASVIGASYQQLAGSTTLSVTDASLLGLSIAPLAPWVSQGTTAALEAIGLFSDGSAQPMTNSVQWTVDDPSLAFFLASVPGVVEGFAAGQTVVEAQAGPLLTAAPLTVSAAAATGLEVTPALPDPLGVGSAVAFGAWATFSDEGVLDVSGQASWTSTNPQVLSILASAGTASALDGGVATVLATFDGLAGAATQTVDGSAAVALLIWPPFAAGTVGLANALTVERVLADGTVDDATHLAGWMSSCPSQLEVSTGARGGALAARSPKTCTVTAQLGTLGGAASVVSTSRLLQRLDVTPAQFAVGPLGAEAFVATAVFSDGTAVDVTSVTAWTAGPEGVATVGNGPQAGQAFAQDAGTSLLLATYGSMTAKVPVTVGALGPVLEVWPPLLQLQPGIELQLRATAVWPLGDTVDVTAWTVFTSSAPTTVGVSNALGRRGLLAGLAQGAASVTATFGSTVAFASVAVDAATPTGVTVSAGSPLPVGEPASLQASAQFSDGSQATITGQAAWTSSSTKVLRVHGTGATRGTAVALDAGTAEARALFAGLSGAAGVVTSPGGVPSLAIQAPPQAVPAGVRHQLAATAQFSNGVEEDVTSRVVWSSASPAIASVSNGTQPGVLTAHGAGASQLSAAYEGTSTSTVVTVSGAVLTTVAISPSTPSAPLGVETPLRAMGTFSDGSLFDLTAQARWFSASPALLAVSNGEQTRGTAMGLFLGSTDVSATVTRPDGSGVTGGTAYTTAAAVPVSVVIQPAKVSLSLASAPSIALRASARFSDGTARDVTTQVAWSVDGAEVASVSASGTLNALQTGATTAFAALGGVVGSAPVQVAP